MTSPLISVKDLSVSLSVRRVIDAPHLSVHPDEFIGLLGPNGAGKTTLMRAILGLVPFSGTIDVSTSLGYVPQRHDVEWDFPISVSKAVLIARVLACEPEVLLLDEPFTGLDAPNTEELLLLFDTLTAEGTSVVMSTHNLSEAAHSCSRLVLFNRGIIADGPAEMLRMTSQPWSDTFGVSASSPLLSAIGVAA